jgi:DegV family protein with EDD domain
MRQVAIVTDSPASIPPELVEEHSIHLIPFNVHVGKDTFRDRIDMMPDQFFRLLRKLKEFPTTSAPSEFEYAEVFKKVSTKVKSICCITITSKWSVSHDAAVRAKESMPDANIEIFDSGTGAGALAHIVLAAARAADLDQPIRDVMAAAERARQRVSELLTVDTLTYMAKGGRIGNASRFLGSLLSIKPILELNPRTGIVEALERVRGKKKAIERIMEIMGERIPDPRSAVHVIIDQADAMEEAQALKERILTKFNCSDIHIMGWSPVIGTHLGPGTLGLSFYSE